MIIYFYISIRILKTTKGLREDIRQGVKVAFKSGPKTRKRLEKIKVHS